MLPAILAILTVLSATALIATDQYRTRSALAESQLRALQLQGLADGAARLLATGIVLERLRGLPGFGLPRNGAVQSCELPRGRRLAIAIQDHAGLIDLNGSSRDLLETAFRALGIEDADALRLAAEMVDYRDSDENPEPNGGAEQPQYAARGLPYGPRNGPFVSVDEIERLPSMTAERADRLREALTVYNPGGGIDPALVRAGSRIRQTAAEGLRAYATPSLGRYIEIQAVVTDSGGRAARSAMVSVGSARTGTRLMSWQPTGPDLGTSADHPACQNIASTLTQP